MLDIKPGDLFATPPNGWLSKMICKRLGAKTFHWGIILAECENKDFITSESTSKKGTSVSRLAGRKARIYRLMGIYGVTPLHLVAIHSEYGELPYDWQVGFWTGLWWLLKSYFKVILPVRKDNKVNCQEWVCLVANELGVHLTPDDEYPICTNLENSPYLQDMGVINE